MEKATAYFREAGSGTSVICIHSSASSSGQWRALMASLSLSYRAVAVDLYGYGRSPDWPQEKGIRLADEIALIDPILADAGRFHLVGHSHGAQISLKIAIDRPNQVASLTLYEPTAFFLLESGSPERLEIEAIRDETRRLLETGQDEKAGECFVDYWVGAGTWQSTPAQARAGIIRGMRKVRFEWPAGFEPSYSPREVSALPMPILLLSGTQTRSPARAIMSALRVLLPAADRVEFENLGHMGPVTHADIVNEAIVGFIQKQ